MGRHKGILDMNGTELGLNDLRVFVSAERMNGLIIFGKRKKIANVSSRRKVPVGDNKTLLGR